MWLKTINNLLINLTKIESIQVRQSYGKETFEVVAYTPSSGYIPGEGIIFNDFILKKDFDTKEKALEYLKLLEFTLGVQELPLPLK